MGYQQTYATSYTCLLLPNSSSRIVQRFAGLHGAAVNSPNQPYNLREGPMIALVHLLVRGFGTTLLREFDAIHTVNASESTAPVPTYNIPNWVDCSKAAMCLSEKQRDRRVFKAYYVGRPTANRGFEDFLKLTTLVDVPEIQFVTVTPAESDPGTNPRIASLGYVPHEKISEVLTDADVLIQPIRNETFGRIILESLVCGTPVITTPSTQHIAFGVPLLYAATANEMRNQLLKLYALWRFKRSEYDHMCKLGVTAALKYDRDIVLPKLEMMLKEVATGNSKPRSHVA